MLKKQQANILGLLKKNELMKSGSSVTMEPLSGDGSDRIFHRIILENGVSLIGVFPAVTLARGAEEQAAAFRIGVHLYENGVPVPEIVAYDRQSGLILFEDLGDLHLQGVVKKTHSFSEVEHLYQQAIDALIRFQINGCRNFDTRFCWDTICYDEQVMLERESDYFMTSFCKDYMGKIADDPRLTLEFHKIARRAAEQPAHYLLHRDFQSRNLMVHDDKVRIIDYQGARLGPLGYDLASLLIDPYAGLGLDVQESLLEYYINKVGGEISLDSGSFTQGYYCLALQRNLQILGAFAFLTQQKGKTFFEQFILPAVSSLQSLLRSSQGKEFPALMERVNELKEQLEKSQFLQMED